jgi:Flp pilus assembly protein TadD
MLGRHSIALFLSWLSLSVPLCRAQRVAPGVDSSQAGNIQVRVEYPNNQPAGRHLRVQLMNGSGSTPISENFTNEQGTAQFISVPIGEYHIVVSGDGIQEADSGQVEIDRRKLSQSVYITVRPVEQNTTGHVEGPATVSKADLTIPGHAQKEFNRASDAMAHQDWPKALQHLQRAIEIYPTYPMGYNNLGVVYGHMNDLPHEREAFQKAVDLDSHFAPGYVNLAMLALREQDAAKAAALLENANRAEPNNPEIMTVLAQAQLLNKNFDAAIRTAHDVHALPHEKFAIVHYIAARAEEREGHFQDAFVELRIFLTEEPSGPRADHVREEMAQLQQKPN